MSSAALLCIRCALARFPGPDEQCYKFGGLICTVDGANVGKYDRCRFGYTAAEVAGKRQVAKGEGPRG